MAETTLRQRTSLLDRPLPAISRISWWHVACAAIILFVLFTRLWDLGPRGYSHDESEHAWFAWKLITGESYVHDPTYHGPFLYFFTGLIFVLFGHSDYTAAPEPGPVWHCAGAAPAHPAEMAGKTGCAGRDAAHGRVAGHDASLPLPAARPLRGGVQLRPLHRHTALSGTEKDA